ncbi:hypothetical protein [Brucella sp. 2716]|uniref:hypothetical protein n=1 Tax=Brucella sp. 2716 TaxID=2975052 RepID=UPI00217CC8B2|nr:hypothetical protein [Brucella sp. 2716]UWF58466.1 hypothetical protein NYO66_07765 [Brucella sp. 2716]
MPKLNDKIAMENCCGVRLNVTRMVAVYPVVWIIVSATVAVTTTMIRQIAG